MDQLLKKTLFFLLLTTLVIFEPRVVGNNITVDDPFSATFNSTLTGVSSSTYVGNYIGIDNSINSFITDGINYTILNNNILSSNSSFVVNGISGTTIFGNYTDSSNLQHGFLNSLKSVIFTPINNPLGLKGTTVLDASGNNLVGNFINGSGVTNSYFYNGTNYITLIDSNGFANTTSVIAVSGGNAIGNYQDQIKRTFGFYFDGTNYNTVDYGTNSPIAKLTIASGTTALAGISSTTIVGNALDSLKVVHGFLWNVLTQQFTPIDFDSNRILPTWVTGISGSTVVGNTILKSGITNGFKTIDNGSSFQLIQYPSVTNGTTVLGIGSGTIYGTYQDSNSVTHNFVTADGFTYTTVDGPPSGTVVVAASTNLTGTNSIGTYKDIGDFKHYFFFDGFNYTTIVNPSEVIGSTVLIDISGNNMVGTYTDSNSMNIYGFITSPGRAFTNIMGPVGANGGLVSIAGIDANRVVGTYLENTTGNGFTYGFLTINNGQSYNIIKGPADSSGGLDPSIGVVGVSSAGVAGNYSDANFVSHGYFYNGTSYKVIDDPFAQDGSTVVTGVSGGSVVGTYADANSPNTYGFVLNGTTYTTIYGPDGTNGNGINSIIGISGNNIVGTYPDSNSVIRGFLYNATNYTTLDFPDTLPGQTFINGVIGSMIYGSYNDTSALSHGFYIQRSDQSINFPPIASPTYAVPFISTNLLSTNSLGLPITYTVLSGSAFISNNILTFTGAGTVTIEASQSGNNSYYAAASQTNSVTVAKGSQTISFGAISNQIVGIPFAVNPTASSGLQVKVSVLSGPATNSGTNGSIINPTGMGMLKLVASQPGDSNYLAAQQITNSVLLQATQGIALFTGITNIPYTTNPVVITLPAASSGLPVTLSATGVATNIGNLVTFYGTGTVTLTASQSGNSNYLAALPISTNFVVTKGVQSIDPFPIIQNKSIEDLPFAIQPPKSSSGLPVAVTVLSGPAALSNDIVSITGAGTVTLAADQSGNSNYLAASEVTTTFTVSKKIQTISQFATIPNQNSLSPVTFAIPTASSGLPVTVSVLSGAATIAGNVVTPTSGLTTIVLVATQAGDSTYNAASQITTSFSIGKLDQNINNFTSISDRPFSTNPITITPPSSSSGLSVQLSLLSGPATLSGDSLTLTGVGTVILAANQQGDATYGPAAQLTTNFTIYPGSQTISPFANIPNQRKPSPVTIVPPTGGASGQPVIVTVLSGPATISGNTVTPTAKGIVVLAANESGSENYQPAPQVTTSFLVTLLPQTIAPFSGEIVKGTISYSPQSITLPVPKSSSGLPVKLSILSGPAALSGNQLHLLGTGTVILAANQKGNPKYGPAPQLTQSLVVTQAEQTIHPFVGIKSNLIIPYSPVPFNVTIPKSTSGLPVTLTASGAATNIGNTLTLEGVGTVTLTATQSGTTNYLAAVPVSTNFVVKQATQTIKPFKPIPTQATGISFTLTAPSGGASGQPVTISILSGTAQISTNSSASYTITPTSSGSVTLAANQQGDANYSNAPEVKISFKVK